MATVVVPRDDVETRSSLAGRVGLWAAAATAVLALTWFALFAYQLVALPSGWSGIEEYAGRFTRLDLVNLWPALPLAWAYLCLVAALHYLVAEERRVLTLSALALGVVYATMTTINYTVQIVAVAPNLLAGELDGLHLWAGANFDSVFWALALGYGVMALSMFAAGAALPASGSWRWVRRSLLIAGASAPLQFGFGLLDWPAWVGVPGTLMWLVGLVGACATLAWSLRRSWSFAGRDG